MNYIWLFVAIIVFGICYYYVTIKKDIFRNNKTLLYLVFTVMLFCVSVSIVSWINIRKDRESYIIEQTLMGNYVPTKIFYGSNLIDIRYELSKENENQEEYYE